MTWIQYLCVVMITDWPLSLALEMVFHDCRLETGSIPDVGSSSSTIGGSPINATAVLTLRRLPPLDYNISLNNHLNAKQQRR